MGIIKIKEMKRIFHLIGKKPFEINLADGQGKYYCPFYRTNNICECQSNHHVFGEGCGIWTCLPERCPLPTEGDYVVIIEEISKSIKEK